MNGWALFCICGFAGNVAMIFVPSNDLRAINGFCAAWLGLTALYFMLKDVK